MNKSLFYIYIIYVFTIYFVLTSCDTNDDNDTLKSYFSFTYNSKKYNLGEFNVGAGGAIGPEHPWIALNNFIWINRPDIFGGVILFRDPNCTFLSPINNNLNQLFECQLTSNGNTIDAAVYFYKSGSHTSTSTKHSTYRQFDFNTGTWYVGVINEINGTFNLELVNSENKTISITNGKYYQLRNGN